MCTSASYMYLISPYNYGDLMQVLNFDCYDCYQQNPNRSIVQEDVHI